MRIALAEKLLVKVMDWSPSEVTAERPLIQAMASFKYDEYQQFSPGIRYIESLARWLNQFELHERIIAYNFVKNNLIFISSEQLSHLVNICFDESINPILITKASRKLKKPEYLVKSIYSSPEYKQFKRRSLFLGLSDGAKIDQLRRSSGLSNEQIFSSYYISSEKVTDMLKNLSEEGYEGKFDSVFLIDDFTASGLSYFRIEESKFKGKIHTFLNLLYFPKEKPNPEHKNLPDLINTSNPDIHIIFYIARRHSLNYLNGEIQKWKEKHGISFNHSVDAIQILDDSLKEDVLTNTQFIELAKKYFDSVAVVDDHYEKGKHDNPYLGFDECALPLILNHNTPNNTLPILWLPETEDNKRGLFPRVKRHKDE